jgi:hypothetical protein
MDFVSQVRPRDRCAHEMGVSSSQMVNEVGVCVYEQMCYGLKRL